MIQLISNKKANADALPEFLKNIKEKNVGFHDLDFPIDKIKALVEKNTLEEITILGMGGSALGAATLYEALPHTKTLHVIDNIDPTLIKDVDPATSLFLVISKSGKTIETMALYSYFKEKAPEENFIFISSESEIKIPENVCGRFSVLTPAGLVPAALTGVNIEKILKGATSMRDKFISEDPEENLPFQLAAILHEQNKPIHVLIPYSNKLKRFTEWWAQLLAESLGKDGKGVTPVKALGATDQHSQLQLMREGPNDKSIIFIEIENHENDVKIPDLEGKSLTFGQLIKIEKNATEKSLTENDRPNLTIKIPSISEESLGELFMLFMGATAFLGEFLSTNAFDQPGVELGKTLTKEQILKL